MLNNQMEIQQTNADDSPRNEPPQKKYYLSDQKVANRHKQLNSQNISPVKKQFVNCPSDVNTPQPKKCPERKYKLNAENHEAVPQYLNRK